MVCYQRLLATEHRRVAVYVFRDFARGIGGHECLSLVEGSVGIFVVSPAKQTGSYLVFFVGWGGGGGGGGANSAHPSKGSPV